MAASDPEFLEIIERQRARNTLAYISASVGALVMIAFIIVTFFVLVPDSNHVRDLADRGDCKTKYDSLISEEITLRGNLTADLNAQLGSALIQAQAGTRPTAEVVQRFEDTEAALQAQIKKVMALPSLELAVERGFTLDGNAYPPCPTVG